MLLSIQQKYILEVLKKLGCIRQRQLRGLVQEKFPEMDISDRRMEAMLRQLRCGLGNVYAGGEFVRLSGMRADYRRLEAVDVMLELSERRLQNFSADCQGPELLRFFLEGSTLRLFSVATLSDPLDRAGLTEDHPGRVVWTSDDGAAPPGLALPSNHFFAARQPDGSHRFYSS